MIDVRNIDFEELKNRDAAHGDNWWCVNRLLRGTWRICENDEFIRHFRGEELKILGLEERIWFISDVDGSIEGLNGDSEEEVKEAAIERKNLCEKQLQKLQLKLSSLDNAGQYYDEDEIGCAIERERLLRRISIMKSRLRFDFTKINMKWESLPLRLIVKGSSAVDFITTNDSDITRVKEGRRSHGNETFRLSGADFERINLKQWNLRGANLSYINLRAASLDNINLSDAVLTRADLSDASLLSADLRNANFLEADLSGTHINKADLRRASFPNAIFSDAKVELTDLRESRLDGATGG